MEFSRKFRELVAGELQRDVANKLGFTASRISQIMRGEKPSREFVERVIESYEVDRDEWLACAGFGPKVDPADERVDIALRAAEQVLRLQSEMRETGKQRYWRIYGERYQALEREGISMLLPSHHPNTIEWDSLTPEEAEELVANLERRSRERHAAKQ